MDFIGHRSSRFADAKCFSTPTPTAHHKAFYQAQQYPFRTVTPFDEKFPFKNTTPTAPPAPTYVPEVVEDVWSFKYKRFVPDETRTTRNAANYQRLPNDAKAKWKKKADEASKSSLNAQLQGHM